MLGMLMLAWAWHGTEGLRRDLDQLEPVTRRCARATLWGVLLWLAARTGPVGYSAFDAVANLGAGVAFAASLLALSRIARSGGLLAIPRVARSGDATIFAALLWSLATALPAIRALVPGSELIVDPLAIDYATTTATIASLLLSVATTVRLRWLRRFELGAGDRASAALTVAIAGACVALPAGLLDIAAPDRALPATLLIESLFFMWVATTPQAAKVVSFLRGALAIAVLGGPTVMLAAVVARQAPIHGPWLLVATAALSTLLGLVARNLSRPLAPDQQRTLRAIEAATDASLTPDPHGAVRAALEALAAGVGNAGARPELWRADPPAVVYVDVAGLLHEEPTTFPDNVLGFALEEPSRTLTLDALRQVQVRRPDTRPVLGYLQERKVFSATVLSGEDGPLGLLVLPMRGRRAPLSLEEAQALVGLTDRLGSVLGITASQARSRKRELEAIAARDQLAAECTRLRDALSGGGIQRRLGIEQTARAVRTAAFSGAARMALEQIERHARTDSHVALLAPPGVDVQAWASVLHLASERAEGIFMVLDALDPLVQACDWQAPQASPLYAARGGTLVLMDAAALDAQVQLSLARDLLSPGSVATPSTAAQTGLVLVLREPPEQLLERGVLAELLYRRIADAVVKLPALVDRPEDLRALIFDRLARLGMALRGAPFAVEPAVLRELIEYTWPGNELELEARLIALIEGTAASPGALTDLEKTGFPVQSSPQASFDTPRPNSPKSAARLATARRDR